MGSHPPGTEAGPAAACWRETLVIFSVVAALYLAIAAWAILGHNLVMGDAISRLANASYALRGRDPHLEAIGFVWNPLPTLVMMVLLLARRLWAPLGNPGLAASWSSALFMAATVAAMVRTLRRWGFSRRGRIIGGLALAANPLIVFYAVNGMSEAFFLFFLVVTVSGLAEWLTTRRPISLVATGSVLGLCYLVRYEAVAAAAAVTACIAGATVLAGRRHGRQQAVSDAIGNATVAVLPTVFTFAAFAGASWLITGGPFQQFTSQYGNTSVLATTGAQTTLVSRSAFSAAELTGAAPLLIPLLAAVVFLARAAWAWRATAAVSVLGGVLLLSALLQASGATLPFLRFWIVAVPLQVLLGAVVAGQLAGDRPLHRQHHPGWWPTVRTGVTRSARTAAILTACAASATATWAAMQSPAYGQQEHQLAGVVHPARDQAGQRQTRRQFTTERALAAYLDQLRLPRGAVLLDVLDGFPIVLASENPAQFVIPSDRDFAIVLGDPVRHHVRYLLTVPPVGRGAIDALNRRFPGIYDTGSHVATLFLQADADGTNPAWRLYALDPAAAAARVAGAQGALVASEVRRGSPAVVLNEHGPSGSGDQFQIISPALPAANWAENLAAMSTTRWSSLSQPAWPAPAVMATSPAMIGLWTALAWAMRTAMPFHRSPASGAEP